MTKAMSLMMILAGLVLICTVVNGQTSAKLFTATLNSKIEGKPFRTFKVGQMMCQVFCLKEKEKCGGFNHNEADSSCELMDSKIPLITSQGWKAFAPSV